MLYAAATLFGIGLAFLANNMRNTACIQWFKKRYSTMISIVAMCGQGTGMVAATLFAFIIAACGWRNAFWITCALFVVVTIASALLYKGSPEELGVKPLYADDDTEEEVEQDEESGLTYHQTLKTYQFWCLMGTWLLVGIAGYALMSTLVLFSGDYGYSPELSGLLLSICLLSSTVFSPVGGLVCDKFSAKWLVAIGMVGVVISCVMLCAPSLPYWALVVAAVLVGFGWNCCVIPIAPATIEAFGKRDFAKKSALIVGMQCLGTAIAPPMLNAFYDAFGSYVLGLWVMAAIAVVSIVLVFPGTRPAFSAASDGAKKLSE